MSTMNVPETRKFFLGSNFVPKKIYNEETLVLLCVRTCTVLDISFKVANIMNPLRSDDQMRNKCLTLQITSRNKNNDTKLYK